MTENDKSSFAAMFEAETTAPKRQTRARTPRLGERVDAVVVKVGKDSVFVELAGKQQAFFEAEELRGPDGEISLKEGDKVTANIVEVDEARGVIRLGKTMGRPGSAAAVEMAKQSGTPVEGKVISVNKGGFDVDLGGVRAFCPISQIDKNRTEDTAPFIGQSYSFIVTDFKEGGRNVVVSRRAFLEREASDNAVAVTVGAVMKGTITAVRDFGAFVDLGGVEGLIPRSEISHDRSVAASDALKPGDQVEVQVREIKDDPTKKPARKITLSLKALTADPWAGLDIAEGRVMMGTVVRTAEFGAFVRLAPGVDGLLHVSEQKAAEGEEVRVAIKKIDRESKKISLVPAPDGAEVGSTIKSTTIAVGSIVEGKVERIETYGLFVQVNGTKGRAGRGLVPNVEIGVPRGTDLRKLFPEGTAVTAKVLETGEGKLRLSIKGAKDAEERADFEQARTKGGAPKTLGTFADLLKGRKL